ncbi:MAG: DUF814 domain-containing protein [Acidobacteria bacterium]|nr:DUF814 domain-containing protein [Acidobacteriota bacterium]NIM60294.1 DUF814 domain-containing protein [Acidobacteriota bacterium]NIQ85570.1 DUF814 domain-containing protein [Acidobacteriota bacterium]NIT11283.1 DUF814 domain-containing protein [Acidobacteriota bacterium]
MDNFVLTTVARVLDQGLRGHVLDDVQQDSIQRFRLRWESGGRRRSTAISMQPEEPWIARPCRRREPARFPRGRFAREFLKTCRGARLDTVVKPSADRRIEMRFAEGHTLVVELAVHGANLVLVDARGCVLGSLRRPRKAHDRVTAGQLYRPPDLPAGVADPFANTAAEIDAVLQRHLERGEPLFESTRRHLFGVGSPAATLIGEEASATGRTHGTILADRIARLREGRLEPMIEARAGETAADLDPEEATLWPWQPEREPHPGRAWLRGGDAAETAGWWHEARDARRESALRRRALVQIVRGEASRIHQAVRKCERDLQGFEDPERYRRQGEALLAGLTRARRIGTSLSVPDPRDPDGPDLVIPAPAALPPAKVAERLFARHRRAVRGRERAQDRLDGLRRRERELADLERRFDEETWSEERVTADMRALGLPVALEPDTRAGREAFRRGKPRMEGVRLYYASSGEMILAGKGGRENHRLTFKLAAPHDFWLHALDVRGAHVILRNETRASKPGPALAEAAAVAAFHSQAATQPLVDVQWTARKNVKKPRGAPPGTVVLKRFETIRVRPGLPT